MTWHDYSLTWDPKEYEGVTDLRFKKSQLWTPDVLLYNSADPQFDSSYQSNVLVYPDGVVNWIPPGIFRISCRIAVAWFPFDLQECFMKFGSWTFDGSKLSLEVDENGFDLSSYTPNGEWELLSRVYSCVSKLLFFNMRRPILEILLFIDRHCRQRLRKKLLSSYLNYRNSSHQKHPALSVLSRTILRHSVHFYHSKKSTLLCFQSRLALYSYHRAYANWLHITSRCWREDVSANYYHAVNMYFPKLLSRDVSSNVGSGAVLRRILRSVYVYLRLLCCGHHTGTKLPPPKFVLPRDERHAYSHYLACTFHLDSAPFQFRQLMLNWLPWILMMHRPGYTAAAGQMSKVEDEEEEEKKPVATEEQITQLVLLHEIHENLSAITEEMREVERNKSVEDDWKFAAMVVDRLCLFIFSFFIMFSILGCFSSVPNISRFI
ncbi:Neurotransmitter-gated ion-channel ligand binding domain protein [Oesophagostomum dentatum]|uniref:Neurotransmitter-gated ion-channel ligand binding domain protein n=1 Tax=Oesophagostomum dentatum TaxID=61180 RepID=A0A0B1S3J1_OESDE|nr:Neurotransmitter-gated ion-channel ligand binding domain protein [Oesophagostomum dentatum]